MLSLVYKEIKMENITVTAQITKELYEMIRKEAYLQNVSNSEIIRQCCKAQLVELKVQEDKCEPNKI